MLRMLTAYAYVKNLSAATIVKVICGEDLVSYAEELHEKYNSLWTLQALYRNYASLGGYNEQWGNLDNAIKCYLMKLLLAGSMPKPWIPPKAI